MNHNVMRRLIIAAAACFFVGQAGCGSDAITTNMTNGKCGPDKYQAGNGECYADKACEACGKDEVCVGGACFDKDSECAKCDADQTCVGGKCYNAGNPCAKCDADQTCVGGKCFDADDPCAKCDPGQACIGGKCYAGDDPCSSCTADQACIGGECFAKTSPCAQCDPAQVCRNSTCYDADDPCAKCQSGTVCHNGECVEPAACNPACSDLEVCDDGTCRPCDVPCVDMCCSEGQACDALTMKCGRACNDGASACGGFCCFPDESCEPGYGCVQQCTDAQTRCDNPEAGYVSCCDPGYVCENMECQIDCGSNARCNGLCCGNNEVCENDTCKIACESGTRCGASEEFCCDNATEICIYQKCLARGADCKDSNQCGYDEFCDESTHTCVKVDADPNACLVKPEKGKFEPTLKWHWPTKSMPGGKPGVYPEFDQVMNNPAIINLTDDNGDGKINEDDVPDLVFTTFSKTVGGHHYTGPNVLRAISGKDGTELATHPDIMFPLANDPGIAKVDHDEFPEIVLPKTENNVEYTVILNLKPKADKSGYEFVEVARLAGGSRFARFANLDGSEYPQIITSGGIIEYVNGKYQWRCKAGFGNGDRGYTIADLDGDTTPEIVGSHIFNNKCEKISNDEGVYYGTVLGDIDLVDDNANGRLDVEQIVYYPGGYGDPAVAVPPPGIVYAYKLFKQNGKFRRELMWETKMPIDYVYAESHMTNYKYSDGSSFKCNRISNPAYKSSGGTSAEYNEWFRRYMCATGGGPLVLADFDGDHKPDIGQATGWSYVVYRGDGKILWADFHTQDYSSKATGSSLFDFEGDGIAEVLYADETLLHVYTGPGSGKIDPQFNQPAAEHLIDPILNSSGTLIEYPLVVDIDNDNHSEIVVTSNDYAFLQSCTGIRAFGDPGNHWVRTRRIWNQYDYHVTNINEDGTVPKVEDQNWKNKLLNNFRQNVQPNGLFNAPNLVAKSLVEDQSTCQSKQALTLVATAENKGSLGIPAGLRVTVYIQNANRSGQDVRIADTTIDKAIAPGSTASVSIEWNGKVTINGQPVNAEMPATFYFKVDEGKDAQDSGAHLECIEDDNTSQGVSIAGCPPNVA